jgi:hypothetical protein
VHIAVLISIGSFICLLAAVLLLGRYLPAQNVAFVILLLAGVEVAVELWQQSEDWVQAAFFWPGAIILLRAGGQQIMKPWRQAKNYGVVVLGFTSGCAAAIQLCADSLGGAVLRFCTTTVCLLFLTPWLIQKRVTASAEAKK